MFLNSGTFFGLKENKVMAPNNGNPNNDANNNSFLRRAGNFFRRNGGTVARDTGIVGGAVVGVPTVATAG